ncbi:MAG: phosphocholine cytidylyltransferase family protein [Lachnospiraceae bacterium]|nr:phosphocholine cytidylyltransferase family protein [Lachnospiraceae bacterium]
MEITRYEFEILSYIERQGQTEHSLRRFVNELCISGTEITKCIQTLSNSGCLQMKENYLTITEKGLSVLEPYRVKKAIVLAAGFGSRMMPATKTIPKPMVTVNGVRIIDTLLDALVNVGIKEIFLVRGYHKEAFDDLYQKYPFLKFIDNEEFDRTNNISSVLLALNELENCYLCEADLYISNPQIITKYQYASNILGSYSLETDDWCFRMIDGYASDYKKGNTYCYNYYGISYWTPDDCKKLKRDFIDTYNEPGGKDYFWEFVPLVLKKDNYGVEIRPCNKEDIVEIDNYYELAQLDPSYK